MPYPSEYQRATDHFADFLTDVRDESGFSSTHQAFTTAQGVLQVFRRRLGLADAIRFAGVLPVCLRALFVADWDPGEGPRDFRDRRQMTDEVRALRSDHNFSTESSIRDVAIALRRHVDVVQFDALLATLPAGAADFWSVIPARAASR
ncbi:MAG: DUF2267 domain-containing protein [Gemmatimonadaceae bacterium]